MSIPQLATLLLWVTAGGVTGGASHAALLPRIRSPCFFYFFSVAGFSCAKRSDLGIEAHMRRRLSGPDLHFLQHLNNNNKRRLPNSFEFLLYLLLLLLLPPSPCGMMGAGDACQLSITGALVLRRCPLGVCIFCKVQRSFYVQMIIFAGVQAGNELFPLMSVSFLLILSI